MRIPQQFNFTIPIFNCWFEGSTKCFGFRKYYCRFRKYCCGFLNFAYIRSNFARYSVLLFVFGIQNSIENQRNVATNLFLTCCGIRLQFTKQTVCPGNVLFRPTRRKSLSCHKLRMLTFFSCFCVGLYYLVSMALCALSVILTVIILNIHFQADNSKRLPFPLRMLFLHYLRGVFLPGEVTHYPYHYTKLYPFFFWGGGGGEWGFLRSNCCVLGTKYEQLKEEKMIRKYSKGLPQNSSGQRKISRKK